MLSITCLLGLLGVFLVSIDFQGCFERSKCRMTLFLVVCQTFKYFEGMSDMSKPM